VAAKTERVKVMYKNVSGQYIFITARDIISDAPKTGDNANLTINITGDNGALGASGNSTTELDATNAPGVYKLLLTQAETNYDSIVITGLSTTAGVEIDVEKIQTQTVPPDNWSDMEINTGGEVNTTHKNNEAYGPNNEATG
jgi:hypothetical protein